jgi:GNAT superfamily N-acetyltransferase
MAVVVLRETELPVEAMVGIVDAAGREGHAFVVRLLRDWSSGANRFKGRGEALFVAWEHNTVFGVVGLNVDPFAGDPRVGRLRHLYVMPSYRRRGIGSELCRRALAYAKPSFATVRLRTPNGRSAPLYERLGFERVLGNPKVTYERAP